MRIIHSALRPCPCKNCLTISMCKSRVEEYRNDMILGYNNFTFVLPAVLGTLCRPLLIYIKAGSEVQVDRNRINKVVECMNLKPI